MRYRHAIPCNSQLEVQAWVQEEKTRLYCLRAELRLDGNVMAQAKARFMSRGAKSKEGYMDILEHENEWLAAHGAEMMRELGIQSGHSVLEFGCGKVKG